jgi:hypothetical protein
MAGIGVLSTRFESRIDSGSHSAHAPLPRGDAGGWTAEIERERIVRADWISSAAWRGSRCTKLPKEHPTAVATNVVSSIKLIMVNALGGTNPWWS